VAQFQEKSWRISDFRLQVVTGEEVGAIKFLKILRGTACVADTLRFHRITGRLAPFRYKAVVASGCPSPRSGERGDRILRARNWDKPCKKGMMQQLFPNLQEAVSPRPASGRGPGDEMKAKPCKNA
jgi:hypothetical protein